MKVILILTIIFLNIFIVNRSLYSQDGKNSTGLQILEIESKNGNKGILLPRVKLIDVNSYLPIIGSPKVGMLVYNLTQKDEKLQKGIYIWDKTEKWVRLITSKDVNSDEVATSIYTGEDDPNKDDFLHNVANGSLYISSGKKIIYQKLQDFVWQPIIDFKPEVENYEAKDGIEITNSEEGPYKKIQVKAGAGLQANTKGVSTNIDGITVTRDKDNKLTLQNENAIWNANRINGAFIDPSGVADGAILNYNSGKWRYNTLNVKNGLFQTIDRANNKLFIGFKVDGETIKINDSNQLFINKDANIWNANKLYGINIKTDKVDNNQILRYNLSGAIENISLEGISGLKIDKGDKFVIRPNIDTNTFINDRLMALNNKNPIWNAIKLQNINISPSIPANRQLLSYNNVNNEFTYTDLNVGPGMTINNDNTIKLLVDNNTLTISDNKLTSLNNNVLWNAGKLFNQPISDIQPKEGDILVYNGNEWEPQSANAVLWPIGISKTINSNSNTKIIGLNTDLAPNQHFIVYGGKSNPVLTVNADKNISFSINNTNYLDISNDTLIFNVAKGLKFPVLPSGDLMEDVNVLVLNDNNQLFKADLTILPWLTSGNRVDKDANIGFNEGDNNLAIKTGGIEMLKVGALGKIGLKSNNFKLFNYSSKPSKNLLLSVESKMDSSNNSVNSVLKFDNVDVVAINSSKNLQFEAINSSTKQNDKNRDAIIITRTSSNSEVNINSENININQKEINLNNLLSVSKEDQVLLTDPKTNKYKIVRAKSNNQLHLLKSGFQSVFLTDKNYYNLLKNWNNEFHSRSIEDNSTNKEKGSDQIIKALEKSNNIYHKMVLERVRRSLEHNNISKERGSLNEKLSRPLYISVHDGQSLYDIQEAAIKGKTLSMNRGAVYIPQSSKVNITYIFSYSDGNNRGDKFCVTIEADRGIGNGNNALIRSAYQYNGSAKESIYDSDEATNSIYVFKMPGTSYLYAELYFEMVKRNYIADMLVPMVKLTYRPSQIKPGMGYIFIGGAVELVPW